MFKALPDRDVWTGGRSFEGMTTWEVGKWLGFPTHMIRVLVPTTEMNQNQHATGHDPAKEELNPMGMNGISWIAVERNHLDAHKAQSLKACGRLG